MTDIDVSKVWKGWRWMVSSNWDINGPAYVAEISMPPFGITQARLDYIGRADTPQEALDAAIKSSREQP